VMTCQPIGSKNSPFRHIQFVPEGKISNLGHLGLDRPRPAAPRPNSGMPHAHRLDSVVFVDCPPSR
jgi:hypothetical protein